MFHISLNLKIVYQSSKTGRQSSLCLNSPYNYLFSCPFPSLPENLIDDFLKPAYFLRFLLLSDKGLGTNKKVYLLNAQSEKKKARAIFTCAIVIFKESNQQHKSLIYAVRHKFLNERRYTSPTSLSFA